MPAPYEKAIEKTADAVGKVTNAATGLGKFIASVFGATIEEIAGWTHDVVVSKRLQWQTNNVQRIMNKVAELKAPHGELRALPARQASIVLEAIANEDDDELQRLWAQLISAATDPGSKYEIKRVHINLLRSIDPIEAKIILAVGEFLRTPKRKLYVGPSLARDLGAPELALTVYLHHLSSLGCFIAGDKAVHIVAEQSPEPPPMMETNSAEFQPTELLISLLELIRP